MKHKDMIDKKSTLFKNFLEATGNIFIFLPYFFSVSTLLKTLFSPWKNLTTKKKSRAFSLNEFFNVLSFNLISRGMGFIMRLSILIFYLLVQMIFITLLPVFFLLFLLTVPIILFKESFTKDAVQTKEELREGQKWFKLMIFVSLIGAIVSLVLRNDYLLFTFLFIAIATSRSLFSRK